MKKQAAHDLHLWAPGDGHVRHLLEQNQRDSEASKTVARCTKKAEAVATRKGHLLCFWVPENTKSILGSVSHVATIPDLFNELHEKFGLKNFNIICESKVWGAYILSQCNSYDSTRSTQ